MAVTVAYSMEEKQLWKRKWRRRGVYPTCLCDRLTSLCPNCGNVRPYPCPSTPPPRSPPPPPLTSPLSPLSARSRSRSLSIPFFLRSSYTHVHNHKASFLSVFRQAKSKKGAILGTATTSFPNL